MKPEIIPDIFEKLENTNPSIVGHILIRDPDDGTVLMDKRNAIHFEHMVLALARAAIGLEEGHITQMAFGNGASVSSGTGGISYFPPNVTGSDAQLYNQTYQKSVDSNAPETINPNPTANNATVRHIANTTYADMVFKCTLELNEPSGQAALDDALNNEGQFVFDELGLRAGSGQLVTHVVFHPVQKSLNRRIEILYTVRISLC